MIGLQNQERGRSEFEVPQVLEIVVFIVTSIHLLLHHLLPVVLSVSWVARTGPKITK